jgi:hypothetical protein
MIVCIFHPVLPGGFLRRAGQVSPYQVFYGNSPARGVQCGGDQRQRNIRWADAGPLTARRQPADQ